ncbi:hypothetical protein HS088_TW21G01269 [Tripterygium wilfordii]|uniref:Uncharacterized protein n=1 Tax=Tripterygium wilfordii TaxID=458696 RepID=A0A7J7C4S0_TRIWF|nr:uncharacterized protein LOC119988936 [Tripterygium wilfordii]KAF5729112.1 hypothetical protein HS088_TW21G01269 [Tripterygium wilfordii]
MSTEDEERLGSNGWPLGLEIMNLRLHTAPAAQNHSLHMHSTSFSSILSSNLDTGSTASFFQDNSVSLGRLIGFKAGDGGGLYLPDSIHFNEEERMSAVSRGGGGGSMDMSQGICIPRLFGNLVQISRKSSRTRH